jgi:hypothetical protein
MTGSDPSRGTHNWTVKLRLAIDAEDEPGARAIAGEVIQAMDVAIADELQVARSASHRPFWNIVTDLDLSAAGNVTPDDALTRFRYVIRNLPGVTFVSPASEDEHSGLYQWLPDEWIGWLVNRNATVLLRDETGPARTGRMSPGRVSDGRQDGYAACRHHGVMLAQIPGQAAETGH